MMKSVPSLAPQRGFRAAPRILSFDPEAPHWMNRDRFVLSMGALDPQRSPENEAVAAHVS